MMRTSDTKEFKNSIWFCFRQKKRLGRYNKLPVVGRFPVSYHRPTKHSLKVKKMAEHFTSVTNINQWIHHFTLTLKRKHERIEWNIEREKKNIARVSQSALISEFASHSNSLHLIHSGFAHFKRDDVDHSWHGGFAIKIESDHKWAQIMRFHCFQMFPIFYPFILFGPFHWHVRIQVNLIVLLLRCSFIYLALDQKK